MHKALKLRIDGTIEVVEINDYTDIQKHLDWRNDYLPNHDGKELMTLVPIIDDEWLKTKGYKPEEVELSVFACDEGLLGEPAMPINMSASLVACQFYTPNAVLHGNIVVCGCNPMTGDSVDFPEFAKSIFPVLRREPKLEVMSMKFDENGNIVPVPID